MVKESLPRWYDHNADNPPWIAALAEVRHLACREGWCYPHVQAIIVSIDQYAEAALGNRDFFLNKPYWDWPQKHRYSLIRGFGSPIFAACLTIPLLSPGSWPGWVVRRAEAACVRSGDGPRCPGQRMAASRVLACLTPCDLIELRNGLF